MSTRSVARQSCAPLYFAAYPLLTTFFRALLRMLAPRWRVTGRRHIPPRGAVIIAPNHISDLDPPVVGLSLTRPTWFMAKRELFAIHGLGAFLRFARAFPVERDSADRSALRFAEQLLKGGQAVVIFPEGRLAQDGALQPLSAGVTLLALHTGAPIVPCGIAGSHRVLPYGDLCPRFSAAPLRVHFGAPLHFDDLRDLPARERREESTRRLEAALRAAIAKAQG